MFVLLTRGRSSSYGVWIIWSANTPLQSVAVMAFLHTPYLDVKHSLVANLCDGIIYPHLAYVSFTRSLLVSLRDGIFLLWRI